MTRNDAELVLDTLGLDPIQKVYGFEMNAPFGTVSNYDPLVRNCGAELLVQVDEDDRQGSTFLLYRDHAGAFGVAIFGWGSCSGCDALQACTSWQQVDQLRQQLMRGIRWGKTCEELWLWLQDDSVQELKWHYTSLAWKPFLREVASAMFGVELPPDFKASPGVNVVKEPAQDEQA